MQNKTKKREKEIARYTSDTGDWNSNQTKYSYNPLVAV